MDRVAFFKERQRLYKKNPVLFFREVLTFEPDKWQAAVAQDVAENPRVSVRSGQGVGKTGLEAALLLWFLCCFPFPRIVATAPTRQQLHDVLWSEVAKWQARSPLLRSMLKWTKTYIYMLGMEKRWFAVARTATKPENMQGFHESNMLFIVDEASGVRDDILEAILGTLSGENNKLLMCGNPTRTSGVFYNSHTKARGRYKVYHVSSRTSPRTNKDNIQALEDDYGADSNIVRVRVDGEFPLAEDDVFIPLPLVEAAISTDVEDTIKVIELGVDVARFGDDETIIAPKVGDSVLPLIWHRGKDLMWTTGRILETCLSLHERYPEYKGYLIVKIDDTGLGGGVTDRLNEIKSENGYDWLYVIPVNFAGKSPDHHYADISTYMWAQVRKQMQDQCLNLPNDTELVAQFSVRKYYLPSSSKIKLESKDEMKKRGLKSPDRADAVSLACLPIKIRKERRI